MSYFDQFMQQWKMHLIQQFPQCGLSYVATDAGDSLDIKTNTLIYLNWLRTTSNSPIEVDASRDNIAWVMLEKQLKAFADKAEKGTFNLVSKWHLEESQIQIKLNFSYDHEQHIFYVS